MEGTLFFTNYNGNLPSYLQLLIDGDLNFRHSWIKRPSTIELFGDKEVIHRKMEGIVRPRSSNLAVDWIGNSGVYAQSRYDSTSWRYAQYIWESGSNYCRCVNASAIFKTLTGAFVKWSVRPAWYEAKVDVYMYKGVETIAVYTRRWGFGTKDYIPWTPTRTSIVNYSMCDPSVYPTVPQWSVAAYLIPKTGQWYTTASYHKIRECDYDVEVPAPYYWLDYMNQRKPPIPPGLVSNIIRDTITRETTLATNNFANLSEMISLVNDFRKGKLIELVENSKDYFKIVSNVVGDRSKKNLRTLTKSTTKAAADAWLKYRYAYNTTKSDVEQYARSVANDALGRLKKDRVLRGSDTYGETTVHVKMRLEDNPNPNLEYFWIGLNQHGLFPGLYNVWDLIPFSFVADWFSNLGDLFQDIDESRLYWNYYKVHEVLVSVKTVHSVDELWGHATYTWYDRFVLPSFPQWEVFVEDEPSAKVIFYRMIDAVSLVVGSS